MWFDFESEQSARSVLCILTLFLSKMDSYYQQSRVESRLWNCCGASGRITRIVSSGRSQLPQPCRRWNATLPCPLESVGYSVDRKIVIFYNSDSSPETCRFGWLVSLNCLQCEYKCELLFFSICQPCDELVTYLGWTPPSPNVSWDWLQPPHDSVKDKRLLIMNELWQYTVF